MEILNKIQQELKAPKGQMNNFGNYKYRSCEDILEAVKPLLGKSILTITDSIEMFGDRFYIKAKATISEINEKGEEYSVSVTAYAREPLEKKGMDSAQITGATSSYARKYALNGLFCIDDTKDADTQDNRSKATTAPIKAIGTPFEAARKAISEADDLDSLIKVKEQINKSKLLLADEKTELTAILTNKLEAFDPL